MQDVHRFVRAHQRQMQLGLRVLRAERGPRPLRYARMFLVQAVHVDGEAPQGQQLQRLQKLVAHGVVVERELLQRLALLEQGRLNGTERVMAGVLLYRGEPQPLQELGPGAALREVNVNFMSIGQEILKVRQFDLRKQLGIS